MALLPSPEAIVSVCITALNDLKERIEIMRDNSDCRKRIVKKVEEVEAILQQLRSKPSINASEYLESLERLLQKCLKTCYDLKGGMKALKLFNARGHQGKLDLLEQDLRDAVDMATLALTACAAVRAEENHNLLRGDVSALHHEMSNVRKRMECVAVRPEKQEGVYPCISGVAPGPLSKPNVSTQGDLLVIEWGDASKKRKKFLAGYTVQYNDRSIQVEPSRRTLKLEPPAIEVGKTYTIRVRAISNTTGPGQWSEQIEASYNPTTCDSLKDQSIDPPAYGSLEDSQDEQSLPTQDSILDPSFYEPAGSPSPDVFRQSKQPYGL